MMTIVAEGSYGILEPDMCLISKLLLRGRTLVQVPVSVHIHTEQCQVIGNTCKVSLWTEL